MLAWPLPLMPMGCKNVGKTVNCLEFSTVSSERQQTTEFLRLKSSPTYPCLDRDRRRFACRRQKSCLQIRQQRNLLWSSGCQVSGECHVGACESISASDHGRLRRTGNRVPNDLLSVTRSSLRSRTPNAVCVAERSRQPRAERTHLFFGSALADHLVQFRLLRPVTTINSTSLAERVSFLVSLGFLSARSLVGKERGGTGAGTWGSCWFPPP